MVYPAPESDIDTRHADLVELVDAALRATVPEEGPYELVPSAVRMNEERSLAALEAGQIVDIVWSSTSIEKERRLLPIRIPMRKGLLGYRLLLIRKDHQSDFDTIGDLAALRHVRMGMGFGWGDIPILTHAGLPVETADYESLFKMLAYGRIGAFPRGLNEIFGEYAARADHLDIAIEQHMLLYYPYPFYSFFNRSRSALAARVELGLRRMIADGSFDRIFWKYNRSAIDMAHLSERRVIRIENSALPPRTLLNDRSLWYSP